MGESGCVSWMFQKKGDIVIEATKADEETVMTLAIEAGADDFQNDGEVYEIFTAPDNFDTVLEALKAKGIETISAEISMIPSR